MLREQLTMRIVLFGLMLVAIIASASLADDVPAKPEGKLRVIVFGAHPDDAEYKSRRHRGQMGETRSSGEAGLGDERRHWPLAIGGWPFSSLLKNSSLA